MPKAPLRPAVLPSSLPSTYEEGAAFGVTFLDTERMVRLPQQGEMVLGRFEHGFSNPPDVDLSFEDGLFSLISRRHACIIAGDGGHWIEDLGSASSTYLNGFPLALGERARLNPGDRIMLGRCRMVYNALPQWAMEPDVVQPHISLLTITHTGQPIELRDQEINIVGRADSSVGYIPDVDLSVAGEVAEQVSRRHAHIITRDGQHYLVASGSASAISINGHPVHISEPPVLLLPGDQVSLGGCVLAYEWRLLDDGGADAHSLAPSMLNRVNWQSLAAATAPVQAAS